MPVSSHSLFHFTDSLDIIINILKDGFCISYSLEEIVIGDAIFKYAVPMVSFCDIPLTMVDEHIGKFGGFGLGLSKEWALNQNQINPVQYVQRYSKYANSIEPFLVYAITKDEYGDIRAKFEMQNLEEGNVQIKMIDDKKREKRIEATIGLLSFLKNIAGETDSNHRPIYQGEKYYYNEREWRYIATEEDYEEQIVYNPFLPSSEFNEMKEDSGTLIPRIRLEFSPSDIDYLIVPSDDIIPELIKHMKELDRLVDSEDEFSILTSKIISNERIMRDF